VIQIKELLTGDDAVSPVIGVILMVAITVILAAVIAAFVLGLGDSSDPAPQVSFDYDYDKTGEHLDVTVQSGDTFEAGNIQVVAGGDSVGLDSSNSPFGSDSTISAGDEFVVGSEVNNDNELGSAVEAGERVDITFTPEEGGESSIIGTFTAPEE
jgi:flagellin-like protein